MFTYQVYGLTLQVNQPLQGLLPASATATANLRIEVAGDVGAKLPSKCQADWIQAAAQPGRQPSSVRVWTRNEHDGVAFLLWFCDGVRGEVEFVINPTRNFVWVGWTEPTLAQDVTTLLLGPVLGCLLRLRGHVCLHGAVVAVGERAIVLLGEKGMGKSTTAAALAKRGYPILADDIAVLTEVGVTFCAQPGYPRLRLWPTALESLAAATANRQRVLATLDKRYFDLTTTDRSLPDQVATWTFQNEALPLGAIYLLQPRDVTLTSPAVTTLPAIAGLMALLGQTFPSFLKLERAQHAQEFAQMSRLTASIPLRVLQRPDSLDKVPALCDLLLQETSG